MIRKTHYLNRRAFGKFVHHRTLLLCMPIKCMWSGTFIRDSFPKDIDALANAIQRHSKCLVRNYLERYVYLHLYHHHPKTVSKYNLYRFVEQYNIYRILYDYELFQRELFNKFIVVIWVITLNWRVMFIRKTKD